jgi:hypothetical protein
MALQNKKSKVPCGLSMSEMMTIEMFYHLQGNKCFKYYYQYFVEVHLKSHFPGLPSYNRFVHLKPRLFLYLFYLLLACRMGTRSGNYIEHSRHRSPVNAIVNILAGMSAYSFLYHKPSDKNKSYRIRNYLTLNNLPMVA